MLLTLCVLIVEALSMIRTYDELITIPTFEKRYEYLKLKSGVGVSTFGSDRYLNQVLYTSPEWKSFRNRIILRDNGCDLAMEDRAIFGNITIHHLNPITIDDVVNRNPMVFDPNNVVCVSHNTHNAIHYGDEKLLVPSKPNVRTPNDTCPWKEGN